MASDVYYYLDSSAFCKVFLEEAHSDQMREFFTAQGSKRRLVVSFLTELETERALSRLGVDPSQVIDAIEAIPLIPVSAEVFAQAKDVLPKSLKSLDAIHLATAMLLKNLGVAMVTFDKQLAAAARQNGIEAISPGL
jgi:predicted nucleic acid-binding protein